MAVRDAVPAEIAQLRARVEGWRRSRSGHGPMPTELWDEAVTVARRRGAYETARGAGIDYGGLAKRIRGDPRGLEVGKSVAVEFVEWSGAEILGQGATPAGAVVEMSDASGRQVSVRMNAGEALDVAGIVAAFCGAHR